MDLIPKLQAVLAKYPSADIEIRFGRYSRDTSGKYHFNPHITPAAYHTIKSLLEKAGEFKRDWVHLLEYKAKNLHVRMSEQQQLISVTNKKRLKNFDLALRQKHLVRISVSEKLPASLDPEAKLGKPKRKTNYTYTQHGFSIKLTETTWRRKQRMFRYLCEISVSPKATATQLQKTEDWLSQLAEIITNH